MSSTDPRTGGLGFALYQLMRPARSEPLSPTREAIAYSSDRRGIAPLCDVYIPDGPGPHPSVIVVHGGGFVLGHRQMKPVRLVATRLCRAGFAVASIDYRLLFRGGGIDEARADVDAAADFWRDAAPRWGCDPDRISLLGLSAGASLVMMHAGRSTHAYHRLVSLYGPTQFESIRGRRAGLMLSLLMRSSDRNTWRERSPLHMHTPTPLLLVHGTEDRLVPVSHSTRLYEARIERDLPTELELFEGMRHGWLNDDALPETDQALNRVIEFLR